MYDLYPLQDISFLIYSLLKGFAILLILFLLFIFIKSIIIYYLVKSLLNQTEHKLHKEQEQNFFNKEDQRLRDERKEKEQEKIEQVKMERIPKKQIKTSSISLPKIKGKWQKFIFNQRKGIISAILAETKGKDLQFWRTFVTVQKSQNLFFGKNKNGRG